MAVARFRVLVVGCGNMANAWVKYAVEREDVEIVGLVDLSRAQAEALADRHKLAVPIFDDLQSGSRQQEPIW